jgi:hypothetical protein
VRQFAHLAGHLAAMDRRPQAIRLKPEM